MKPDIGKLILCLVLGVLVIPFGLPPSTFVTPKTPNNPYYQVDTITLEDGTQLDLIRIAGPPDPPAGYARPVVRANAPNLADGVNIVSNVPVFNWSFGCSATSAAMIAGHYDRNGYPNMYAGPTNGGIMPLDNTTWGYWVDGNGDSRAQCPLSATRDGLDGRTSRGHVDNYWVSYLSGAQDPYVTHGWSEPTPGECTGDFMKTNRFASGNDDSMTTILFHPTDPDQLTCAYIVAEGYGDIDGTVGFRLFYESRGYTVDASHCYSQRTDNQLAGGYAFTDYMAEIDAGHPVMIHVTGHTMVGVGYNSNTYEVILQDTWDHAQHTMTWGGSYAGMDMQAVSVVHLMPWEYNTTATGDWHTGRTWDDGTVPTSSDDVTIKTGHTVTLNANAQCRNLTVQPDATLILADGVTLNVEENVYNNGTMQQVKDVPSDSTTEFLHIQNLAGTVDVYRGLDITSSAAMGSTTVEVKGNHTNGCTTAESDALVNRCYTITPSAGQTATVRFWYTEDERNAQTANALDIWHYDGGTWTPVGDSMTYSEVSTDCTSGTPAGFECWVQGTNISSYSPFGIGSGATPTALNLHDLATQSNPVVGLATVVVFLIALLGTNLLLRHRRLN